MSASKQLVVPDVGASDHEDVIDAYFDLADAIITVRRLRARDEVTSDRYGVSAGRTV
jgi:hypothetical protein